MDAPTSTGIPTQPEPIKPWKQVAEESNIFSLPAEQRVAEYDKWSQQAIAKGIRDGDFDSPDTFSQFKLLDIRTRKNLASDDIVGPSDEDILADYNSFSTAFQDTQKAFASQKPTPEDNTIQDEVLKGKRNAAFVRGQMVFNPTVVNDPQKYREAILESDAPPDIKMLYAGLRPEMEKSATVTRRRELANSVITRDVADKVVNAIQEGTELFSANIGTPQSPALKKNKEGVWSVVDPEYSDIETSLLSRANAKINPLADAQYKPLAAINEYQKKYGLTDEQVQQDYMEALIENAPTAINRWVSKATSVEDYVKQLDSTVRVKNKDVAPEVRVQDPNLFFDEEGYNAAVDKANAPDEAKKLAKEARTQFADAVAGDIYNNLLANRDDFREDYAKDVVERKDMAKAITRYYKDKKDQAWYDDVGEFIGQTGTALEQGGMNVIMTPSAVLGMFGSVKDAEDVRYATMVQNGQMQAEEAVANRTGGAGAIKLTGDVARILPDLAVQMAIGIMSGGALSYSQAAALSARTGISKAAARTAIRQAAITGEKAALKTELARLIPNLSAQAADDVATGALEVAARTASNNPLKGGIGTQKAIGSAYAGLTSAGSTFGQVYTEVRNMGKSPEESIGIARTAGITAGAITGALTHTFGVLGRGGVEDFASMSRKAGEFTIRDIMKSGVYDVLTTQEGRQLARSIASGIAKDALHEGVEEGLDQALNLISQYATNPSPEAQNRKVSEVINESLYATLLGGIAGGGANVAGQARATAPGITAQQMQAEILGADATVAPDVAPPESVAPSVAPTPEPTPAPAPVVQSADPVIQEVAETAKAIADVPDTSQTAAALEALAKAAEAGLPKPEFNLPVVEKAPEPAASVEPSAPANTEEVPVEQPVEPAIVEPTAEQPTEEMKTTEEIPTARDATKPEQMTKDELASFKKAEAIKSATDDLSKAKDGTDKPYSFGFKSKAALVRAREDALKKATSEDQAPDVFGTVIDAANQKRPIFTGLVDSLSDVDQTLSPGPAGEPGGVVRSARKQLIDSIESKGYVKEGELYVFKGEAAPAAEVPAEKQKERPSLGGTGAEIMRSWKSLQGVKVMPGENIVGAIIGGGNFAYIGDKIVRLTKAKNGMSGYTDATDSEIADISDAIDKGQFQIESRKITGLGTYPKQDAGKTTKVLHQATGKPLPEFLQTDEGKAYEARMTAAVQKSLGKTQPTKPNAVQKPSPDEGVLRQEGQGMGLPEVDQGGRGAEQESAEQAEEVKAEVPPEQQDVVVFMDEQNDETEERQKPKKKRITPGEARKAGIAKQIGKLGIQSSNPDSVIGALKKIAAKPPQPHHARIAKDLLSVLEGSGTSIALVASNDPRIKKGDERVNGWYDPATNTAYINLDGPHELGIEETILHELVHASGEKVIRSPQTDAQKRILGDLQKQMEAATKNAISLGQSVLKTKETDLEKLIALAASKNNYALFDILYGVSSLSEYHAHATTSKAFQKFLSEYKEGSKRNFFERFVNSLTRLLSGQKTAEGSDAEKSYATLLDLMREGKGDVRLSNADVVQSRARGRFDLVDAVRAASSGDASTPFVALNEAINANTELTRRIQAESERRSRAYARGKGAILEQIIRAGNSGRLPQESIKPLTDFVNSVSAEALADTRISLSARPQNSTFDFTDSLVTLALNGLGSDPDEIDRTGVHEFWHGLSRFLPDNEIEKMRVDYVAAVKEYISENPWFVPFIGRTHLSETQYDELSRLLSKDEMDAIPWKSWETLDDGRRIRGIKWSKENYRLFRLDEWVAETMADLVRRKQERPTTILGKMARLFRDFIDTLKQALGNPYLRALDAMTMPDEAFDAVIQRYGPIEDNPPVMYGGPAVGVNNQFILGMYAGEKALENLPEEARAFKRDSLEAARAMAAAGKTSEEIRAVTGWFPGKYDGKMRWEIPDNEAELRLSEYRKERIDGKSAKEIVRDFFSNKQTSEYADATKAVAALKGRQIIEYSRKFEAKKKAESEKLYEFYAGSENQEKNRIPLSYLLNHAKLFDAYPELKWIPVSFSAEDAGNDISSVGSYNPSLNIITLNPLIAFNDEAKALSTLLHEIQHAIQKIEGFAKGGNLLVATMAIAEKDIEVDAAKQALRYAEFKYKKLHREAVERLRKENGEEPVVLENERADLEPEVQEAAKELSRAKNDATYRQPAIAAAKVPEGDAFDVYQKIAGEIESRDVQARQSLTTEQRAAIAPYSSENIAPDDALVRFSKARGIVSDAVVKFAPQFNVVDAPGGPSVEFDGRSVTVNLEKLANLEEYEVQDLANRAVVAAIATPKDPIAAGIIQQTMAVEAYNFDSESRKGIRKGLADAHRTAHEFGMAPLAMELGNRLFEFGGATDADVRRSMAKDASFGQRATYDASSGTKRYSLPRGGELVGPTTFSIKAYHGTPHKVDKFSLERIGTGEGAQAYGWGLYFAESQSVAENYRKVDNAADVISDKVEKENGGFLQWDNNEKRFYIEGGSGPISSETQKAIDGLNYNPEGNIYSIEILSREEDFLDWDAPFAKQSQKVRDILTRAGVAVSSDWTASEFERNAFYRRGVRGIEATVRPVDSDWLAEIDTLELRDSERFRTKEEAIAWADSHNFLGNGRGAEVYKMLSPDAKEASRRLAALGIPGIRYLDGISRGTGEGTRNYVIFDDKLIKILEENGTSAPQSRARGTELVTRVSGPALTWKKFVSGFRSRGMVSQEAYDALRDSDAFKKANAAFVSFIAKDFTSVTNKLFGEGGTNLENFRVFSRDATTGEATVSSRGFETRQKAEAFAVTNRYKDYIVSTGQDLINQALGSNGPTLKEDVRDAIEKLTKKGLDDIAKSLEAYKEEYLDYWNLVVLETQADMVDPAQIATLRDRKEQWMAALRLRSEEQKKLVDDARKKAVQAAIEDAKNRIVQQQQFAKAYLPDDLVHQIERAREKIDELSTRLTGINWLMEGSELQMVIEGLNGVYITRSYEAFETSDKAAYVAWLNEAYNALTNRDQAYDPIAMERIMPLVRHIKNGIMERRIEDLKKENDQRQVDAIMEDLMADSRQVTQVDRVPGQPIEGTEYEQLIRAVAKRDLLRRRSDEKKRFVRDMMRYLDAVVGFGRNIGNQRKRVVALRKEANRIYNERYGDAEQQIIADMFGRPQGLQWAVMTDDEAHDIANVERALSESPNNVSGSKIWTSSISGTKHSSFYAAVNDDFQSNLDFITKAPTSKTGNTTATANDWRRLGDKILEHKNDVPAFLRTFLGEKDNPLLRVSDTILKQSHLIAVGELYRGIAEIGEKAGWLVHKEMQATDRDKYGTWVPLLSSKDADQGYENNPLKGMYADPVMAKAIDTLLAANQPSNSAFKVISFVVGASLWNVTAGSVRAIARNLYSLPIFLMNSGILGAVINPTRWPIVAKNIVLASRIVQQSMEATGKVSGGQQITNKGFKLADKFWTGLLSVVAAQRPALYAMRGAASMAEIVGRIKEQPTGEAFQEIYLKAVRLGVANDNVQKEAIHRLLDIEEQAIRKPKDKNMGRFAKALKLEGAVGFGSYLLGTMKSTLQQRSQLYGAPDDFTKIMAWLNEMDTQANIHAKDDAQYKEWVGEDGLFAKMPDEFVKKAADNVTNLIQSHSRVWAHITQFKKAGFGALMAPFAAARAEFYRNAANAYIIAFEEMRSKNKKEQMNGGIRFASALMAHLAMGNAIGAVVKTVFSAFADDDEVVEGSPEYREAVRKLGPEYAKNKNATYILYKNGTFDWVDLSFANPFAFVWDSITAARRGATEKDVEDNIVVAMSKEILEENIGTFAKPQIALDAFAAIRTGYDPVRGVKIWDSQADSFTDKLEKSVSYYLKQAGAPGDYKDAMKIWKASRGVEENGRQYKVGTEVGAVFLGTSIRTVNITDALEQKLAQAKDTLGTRITPLYKAPLRNANDVEMEDVALAVQQYAKAHDQAVSAMQKSFKAAETLLEKTPNAKTLLRNVMSSDRVRMSQGIERAVVTGKPSFPDFSDQTFRKMEDLGKKHSDDRAKVAKDTLKEYNQKKKNP